MVENLKQLYTVFNGEIKEEKVTRVKPGRYSTKSKKKKKHVCENCSSKTCKGVKKCPAYHLECFKCGKRDISVVQKQ